MSYDDFDYDDDDYDEDDGMATKNETKYDDAETGVEAIRTFIKGQAGTSGNNFCVLTHEADGKYLLTEYLNNPCTLGHMRPYLEFVNPAQKDTRGTDPKPGDLPFTFPAGDVIAVGFPEHFRGYGAIAGLDDLYSWYLSKDSPFWSVLKDNKVEILGKPEGNIPFGFILTDTKNVGPSAFASFISISRELSGYAPRYLELTKLFPDKPLADRALASIFVYQNNYGVSKGWGPTSPSQYHLNLIGGNLSRFFRGEQYDIDGGLSYFDRAAYNRPNIHWTFGHGRDNSAFFAKFADPTKPDEIFDRIEAIKANPDDGPFSLKEGINPLVRI